MNQKKEYGWGYDELVVGVPSIFYVIGFLKPKGQNWKIRQTISFFSFLVQNQVNFTSFSRKVHMWK